MANALSKREKILLFILAMVAVFAAGIYLFITPMNNLYFEKEDELSQLKLLKVEMQTAIDGAEAARRDIADYTAKIQQIESEIPEVLTSDEMDASLTLRALDYGLTPAMLSLGDSQLTPVSPYLAQSSATDPPLTVNSTAMTLYGDINDIIDFLDSYKDDAYIRVDAMGMAQDEEQGLGVEVQFIIYMR